MKNLTYILFLPFILLTLTSCSQSENVPEFAAHKHQLSNYSFEATFIPDKVKIVGIGDSLTQGVGDEQKKEGYFGRITEKLAEVEGVESLEAVNVGKRGRRSDQLLEYLETAEGQEAIKDANMIFMTIGGNDVMKIVKENLFNLRVQYFYEELPFYKNRYTSIVQEIRKKNPSAPIIFIGIYNPFTVVTDERSEFQEIVERWNDEMQNVASSDANGCFVSIEELFRSDSKLVYHTDFFHPNSKGYDDITSAIWSQLQLCGLKEITNGEMQIRR
ncbi:GDSL-type esterase/lipase family protein [Paenisporosarcina cavernae]|uniref:GDSL family lipase n=1 Tax=Paenisporosarcina cavernae TaxID=2320858 RepID=A0A385YS58_9BACL|nr:GDSL-type esterase/lipase family protein [Paenisporosarcina cavernae]AYC29446.1 GDSL family lipase [Paenisporosarcina cavernae]